ncbi:uncharacterized protein LOC118539363 isoform X2 [Halichoerus grypus]
MCLQSPLGVTKDEGPDRGKNVQWASPCPQQRDLYGLEPGPAEGCARRNDHPIIHFYEDSVNTVLYQEKLYSRISRAWGNCRGQNDLSALDEAHPERTTFMIMLSLPPDRYQEPESLNLKLHPNVQKQVSVP